MYRLRANTVLAKTDKFAPFRWMGCWLLVGPANPREGEGKVRHHLPVPAKKTRRGRSNRGKRTERALARTARPPRLGPPPVVESSGRKQRAYRRSRDYSERSVKIMVNLKQSIEKISRGIEVREWRSRNAMSMDPYASTRRARAVRSRLRFRLSSRKRDWIKSFSRGDSPEFTRIRLNLLVNGIPALMDELSDISGCEYTNLDPLLAVPGETPSEMAKRLEETKAAERAQARPPRTDILGPCPYCGTLVKRRRPVCQNRACGKVFPRTETQD